MLKLLMKHVLFLIIWLGIRMNLKLVVLILTSYLLASPLMYLLCVKFVNVLIMIAVLVLIIFLVTA